MDDRALPSAEASLLPAVREQGGAVGQQFVDVFVGFRLRFYDESEAGAFARHFRFAAPRSALRQEGAGVVWVGFHGWAFDAADAQTQAALAVPGGREDGGGVDARGPLDAWRRAVER